MFCYIKYLTMKRIEVEEIVRDSPGIVLGPTINNQTISA